MCIQSRVPFKSIQRCKQRDGMAGRWIIEDGKNRNRTRTKRTYKLHSVVAEDYTQAESSGKDGSVSTQYALRSARKAERRRLYDPNPVEEEVRATCSKMSRCSDCPDSHQIVRIWLKCCQLDRNSSAMQNFKALFGLANCTNDATRNLNLSSRLVPKLVAHRFLMVSSPSVPAVAIPTTQTHLPVHPGILLELPCPGIFPSSK
jgi:hypothetical protein